MLLLFACCAVGQMETATISGLVTDRTAAAVSGAEVRLQSVERGTVTTTATNEAGIYVFPSVPPGQYQISIQKQGFKQVDSLGLIVNVQDHIEQNFRLEVGSIAESVTVEAAAAMINTTDASVSTVVDRQFAENLPMNGRSFQSLIQLTPGAVVTPSNDFDSGQFSINGQRADANYWMLDGVSANIGVGVNTNGGGFFGNGFGGSLGSFSAFGGTNSLVSVDAMQEFRIQTSTYAPEFGRTPGGQISIVTRSGKNQFHGTAFDYLRNDALDSNDWFNNAAIPALPKAKERQNDFGGTFSGPLVKERAFFFFSYEGLRLRLPQTALATVPDASFTPGGTTNSRQNATPAMQPYLNAFPLPNPNSPEIFTPCTPNVNGCPSSGKSPTGTAEFNASYSNPATLDAYSLRIDYKLSDKWSFFGRYNYSPSEIVQREISGLSNLNDTAITTQTATLGATWSASPTIANDLRFNYSRTSASSLFHLDSFGGAVPLTSLPFPSPFTSQNGLLTWQSFTGPTLEVGNGGHNVMRQFNIVDSSSFQKGSHSLKFGVDFRRLSPIFNPGAYGQTALFSNIPSAESGNLAIAITMSAPKRIFLLRDLGIYGQDTWRVSRHLTVTYGLRWDVDFVPEGVNGSGFNALTGFNLNDLSSLALAPAGTPPYKTTYGNFAPRVGAAYQLSQNQNWQTVVRGGFGLFYDLAASQFGNSISPGQYPFGGEAFIFGTFPLTPAEQAAPPITPPNSSNFHVVYGFDPHLQLPYTLEWNVAFEQGLGREQTLSASYIGAAGRRLLETASVFNPQLNLPNDNLVTNEGTSDYDALQLQFQRRLSHGLQALASYTWAHSIDTGSAGSGVVVSNFFVPSSLNANRGPSDFDIRNAFSAALTYDIPAPKGNALTNAVLRGWSTENSVIARSAPPVTVNSFFFNGASSDSLGNGFFTYLRPNLLPGQPLYVYGTNCAQVFQASGELQPGQGCPGGKGFNPAAFTAPPVDPMTGRFLQGNVPRNSLRGFGATQWDFAVHRDFPIRESVKLQFRAEMFNVLNHPNFGQPNGTISLARFGLSSQMLGQSLNHGNLGGGAFSPLYQVGGPRSVQLALKLIF